MILSRPEGLPVVVPGILLSCWERQTRGAEGTVVVRCVQARTTAGARAAQLLETVLTEIDSSCIYSLSDPLLTSLFGKTKREAEKHKNTKIKYTHKRLNHAKGWSLKNNTGWRDGSVRRNPWSRAEPELIKNQLGLCYRYRLRGVFFVTGGRGRGGRCETTALKPDNTAGVGAQGGNRRLAWPFPLLDSEIHTS